MAKIELTNDQLRLVQSALETYSRAGILQWRYVYDHPSVQNFLQESCTQGKEIKVGSQTMRGEVVEIGDGYIKTKGTWGNGEEIRKWTDIEKIKLSPDWGKYHEKKQKIEKLFGEINRIILDDPMYPDQASPGIHNKNSYDSLEAFDIIQVIRHEFWKANPNKTSSTVDSHVSINTDSPKVNVTLDTVKDIRKQKLRNITEK